MVQKPTLQNWPALREHPPIILNEKLGQNFAGKQCPDFEKGAVRRKLCLARPIWAICSLHQLATWFLASWGHEMKKLKKFIWSLKYTYNQVESNPE